MKGRPKTTIREAEEATTRKENPEQPLFWAKLKMTLLANPNRRNPFSEACPTWISCPKTPQHARKFGFLPEKG